LAPANAGSKLSDTVTVRLLPDPAADDPLPFNRHWLFCSVFDELAAIGPSHPFPASFTR
jgi:hypothetical protein